MAAPNNIAFANLRAEMGRANITISDISISLDINRDTLGRKLSRNSPLNLDEAFAIRNTFFPELDITYLFREATEDKSA